MVDLRRQGSNLESCVWKAMSPDSFHHPQEVPLVQFILYVRSGGPNPHSFIHFLQSRLIQGGYLIFILIIRTNLIYKESTMKIICHHLMVYMR